MSENKKRGIRYWTERAESHAIGILRSCDDESFWGDDYDPEDTDWQTQARAKQIIINRIGKKSTV